LRHIHPLPAETGAFLIGDCLFLRLAILPPPRKAKAWQMAREMMDSPTLAGEGRLAWNRSVPYGAPAIE
jgi:hypothetical protein